MFAKRLALTALCALTLAGSALAQTQGVQKDSITIGTIQDLSGPISSLGKQVRDGMLMRVDEINATPSDIFGSDTLTFSATDRQGSERARISQIQNGRWKVVADYSEWQ